MGGICHRPGERLVGDWEWDRVWISISFGFYFSEHLTLPHQRTPRTQKNQDGRTSLSLPVPMWKPPSELGVVCGERSANRDIFDWPVGGGNSAVDSQAFHLLMLAHSHRVPQRVRCMVHGVWCMVRWRSFRWRGGGATGWCAERGERDCSSILRVQRAAILVFFNLSFCFNKTTKIPLC